MKDKYLVEVGKYKMRISEVFLKNNNALDNLEKIKEKFINKYKIYERMDTTDIPKELIKLADEVRENEFDIQKLFNFKRSYAFQRWWEVPKCECPKMDNADYWGTDICVISGNCPIHIPQKDKK